MITGKFKFEVGLFGFIRLMVEEKYRDGSDSYFIGWQYKYRRATKEEIIEILGSHQVRKSPKWMWK